jgi:eukaryotic-like serine/threonine-protein kinase
VSRPPGLPDRYRVIAPVANGGMSRVHVGNEMIAPGIRRLVVIKTLLPRFVDDEERRTMFFDEARILARLSHPHVVSLLAAGESAEGAYLILEYVAGPSLRRVIDAHNARGTMLRLEHALRIGLHVAEALAYVHDARDQGGRSLQVVHRDLKPSNVVIGIAAGPKLIDFGIARGEGRLLETATGVLKGTDGYMAPEQVEGRPVDRRVDVFAFGVLAHEMLTGVHPFVGTKEFPSPSRSFVRAGSLRRDLPPAIDQAIAACLELEPEKRPADMRGVARAFAAELGDHPLWVDLSEDLTAIGASGDEPP